MLKESFDTTTCNICMKVVRLEECSLDAMDPDKKQCYKCTPQILECTVRLEKKNAMAIPSRSRKSGLTIRRCTSCSASCSTCKAEIVDWRQFATNSSECCACYKKGRIRGCDARSAEKPKQAFDDEVLSTEKIPIKWLRVHEVGHTR